MKVHWAVRGVALAMLWLAMGVGAATESAQPSAEQVETQRKLEQIRAELRVLSEARNAAQAERKDATIALRERETAISALAREVRKLDGAIAEQRAEIQQLEAKRSAVELRLSQQRETLAALLRSGYALGRHEQLQLLLAQDRVDRVSRVMAYHRYFQRARVGRIRELLAALQEVADLKRSIEQKSAVLEQSRAARSAEAAGLDSEREERARVLRELDLQLKDQATRIAALGRDERALLQVLERLRDIFSDIPQQLEGSLPLAKRRGKLAWPLPGRVLVAFGGREENGRVSAGMVIAAKAGAEVRVVSHGRVAFADWLRGYGLIAIVDHGDGYMSLYGNNEALLKDVGDWVEAGEAIAQAGMSGGRPAPALYFELRFRGRPQDPRPWLTKR